MPRCEGGDEYKQLPPLMRLIHATQYQQKQHVIIAAPVGYVLHAQIKPNAKFAQDIV